MRHELRHLRGGEALAAIVPGGHRLTVATHLIAVRHHLLGAPGVPPWIRYEMIDSAAGSPSSSSASPSCTPSEPSAGMLW